MADDITIPPEALEAFDEADNGCDCRDCKAKAIRAALNAWLGMELVDELRDTGKPRRILVLPLTQEGEA